MTKYATSSWILSVLTMACISLSGTSSWAFEHFITHRDGKLYDGDNEFRFVSWNIPNLHNVEDNMQFQGDSAWRWPDEFEVTDALETVRQMRGKVARIYVISVRRQNDPNGNPGHVLGPGEFNEEAFRTLDLVLKVARDKGVRIIIPLVDNWHWWGGIQQYAEFRGKEKEAFWSDPQIIEDFKLTIDHVINRRNTLTGVKYGDDPTILGWETGNELDSTAEWTRQISAYIKSLDQKHLVIEGKSLHGVQEYSLDDPNIDVVTTHHYNNCNNNTAKHVLEAIQVVDGRKAYFVGEFGFLPIQEAKKILEVVSGNGVSGALYWSLRYHRREGGFYWHDEPSGEGVFKAYHWPGFPEGESYREHLVMPMIYQAAHQIDGLEPAPLPVPDAPKLLDSKLPGELNWQGSTGASLYDIERKEVGADKWQRIAQDMSDASTQYAPLYVDESAIVGKSYSYRVIAKNESGQSAPSNIIGPVAFEENLFCDELNDLSKIHSHSAEAVLVEKGARSANEDISRLELAPGAQVVWNLPGNAVSLRARIYADENEPPLALTTSSNGNRFDSQPYQLKAKASLGKDYGYLTPILLRAELNRSSVRFIAIANESDQPIQISRIQFGYLPANETNASVDKPVRDEQSHAKAARLEPSVLLFHKPSHVEGISSIKRAVSLGSTGINVIVTMHCDLDEDRNVKTYGLIQEGAYVELDPEGLARFKKTLRETFKEAVKNNLRLSVVAHLNSGGEIHDWRNYFHFDPLKKYGSYNYEQAVLEPIIEAMREADVPRDCETDLSLTGEMGSTVFTHAKSYSIILERLQQAEATKDISIGFSFNFNRVDGDLTLSKKQRDEVNDLLSKVDFVGFSNYSWFGLPVDQSDFKETTELFVKNMHQAGVIIRPTMPLHFTEIGIGGFMDESQMASNPEQAVKTPWYGTADYSKNPWSTQTMSKLRTDYHQELLSFLADQSATHVVTKAYLWSEGSWDPMGIRDKEFHDKKITRMIHEHNSMID